jgi:hypothetical protein
MPEPISSPVNPVAAEPYGIEGSRRTPQTSPGPTVHTHEAIHSSEDQNLPVYRYPSAGALNLPVSSPGISVHAHHPIAQSKAEFGFSRIGGEAPKLERVLFPENLAVCEAEEV